MPAHDRSMDNLNTDNSRASARLRRRQMSEASNTIRNDRSSWFSLELLYTITDVVLITCGVVVVISCIASIALWLYGLSLADWEKIHDKTISNNFQQF